MATPNPLLSKPRPAPVKSAAAETPPAEPIEEIIAQQAVNLKDVTGAAQLYIAVTSSIAPHISTEAFKQYRRTLLAQAGSPTDPIEIMLIEQIALAHFHIGRLHLKSCSTAQAPLAVAFADAATRLTAEFRRSALALEDYRAKQIVRKGQAINMDMSAPAPAEQNGKPPRTKAKKKPVATEIESNGHGKIPECLRKRMYPTLEESRLAVSTN